MQLCTAMNLLWQALGIDPSLHEFSAQSFLRMRFSFAYSQLRRLLTLCLQLFLPGDELGYENPSGQQVLAVVMPLLQAEAPM